MDIYHVLGYIGAFATGLILGLLGGGGALLSIPVLVYLFHIKPSVATGYSLFLVAITASSGAINNIRKGLVDFNATLYYGIPSVITIYVVRRFLMPAMPATLASTGGYTLSKDHFILFVLSAVMFIAGYKMMTSTPADTAEQKTGKDHIKLTLYAVLVGAFLGLVGAGGGFIMVPALIYFANLMPKKAIATSLLLVALNSFIGFIGDLGANNSFDWPFLAAFSVCSIAGVFVGHYIASFIQNDKLKKYFGVFIIAVALFIVIKELFFH